MALRCFILCHTFFHDVWRTYGNPTEIVKVNQSSAKFLARYIIEKKSSGGNDDFVAITSEQVMEAIYRNLPNQGAGSMNPAQMLLVLGNLIETVPTKKENINDSVSIIADVLSSHGFDVIMVTNMPSKIEKIVTFYQNNEPTSRQWSEKRILSLFRVINTTELEKYLRETDKATCDMVDKQLRTS